MLLQRLSVVLLAATLAGPFPAMPAHAVPQASQQALTSERVQPLLELLQLDRLLQIIRDEGLGYAEMVRQDMFPEIPPVAWKAQAARVYDLDRMRGLMVQGFDAAKTAPDDGTLGEMVGFFSSDLGRRIITLEVDARRAMLDDAVERQAARDFAEVMETEPARVGLLEDFVRANDLIESNVVGGMNSNYAFYSGLLDGGAFPFDVSEEQILSDVWAQEDEIRSESEIWIYSYLNLAYRPLSNADLGAYVDFSRSDTGRAFNRALFDAFDRVFNTLSYDLGRAAGQSLRGEEL